MQLNYFSYGPAGYIQNYLLYGRVLCTVFCPSANLFSCKQTIVIEQSSLLKIQAILMSEVNLFSGQLQIVNLPLSILLLL